MNERAGKRVLFGLLVTLALCAPPARAAPAPLAWVPPTACLVVPPGSSGRAAPPPVAADEPIVLEPGALLLFPASPGDAVRIEALGVDIGFGTGAGELADAITWSSTNERAQAHELAVPSWSSARFVAVRAVTGARTAVRAFVASGTRIPMAWYRADEDVAAWIFDDRALPAYRGELSVVMPELRRIEATRSALGPLAKTLAGRSFLQAEWLEATARRRPMDAPFTEHATLALEGGRTPSKNELVAYALDEEREHRVLGEGEQAVLRSDDASVVTLVIRIRAVGRSLVRIREGDRLLSTIEVEVPRRAEDLERWTPPRLVRLVSKRGVPLRIETERGESLLSLQGYRQRSSILDGRKIRDRVALLERARAEAPRTPAGRALAALAELLLARSRLAAERVRARAADRGLSAELRVLLLHELARRPLDAAFGASALVEFWERSRGLRPELGVVLRRSALEGASRTGIVLPPGSLPELDPSGGVSSENEDRIVVAALREVIAPPGDRKRPRIATLMDRLLTETGPRDDLGEVAQSVWRKSAPWAWAEPDDDSGIVTRLRPIHGAQPMELCTAEAPEGLRWLFVDKTPTDIVVVPGPGTHARVPLRGEVDEVRPESLVGVDEVPVAVHGAAGLASVIALAPGNHRLLVRSGGPVLARLPIANPVLCSHLREVERWVYVSKTSNFELASPGARSVASIIVDPESMEGRDRNLTIDVGERRHQGLVRAGATGSLEVPVESNDSSLAVTVDRPALVRVRLRLHPRAVGARAVRPSSAQPPSDFDDALERVRHATRYLRLADRDEGRKNLRLDRARALEALGYARLAELDRARSGVAHWDVEPDVSADYLELPDGTAGAVVLGHLGKIAPLPIPEPHAALARAHRARASGHPAREVRAELGTTADRSSAADALLLAELAEELGALRAAAAAYERIGEAHASGEALARAALLYTDAAVGERAPELGLRAYVLARRAEELGALVSGTLGRLDQAIGWQTALLDSAAGLTWIEEARLETDEPSPSEKVRSALLDAPPLARLFGGPELRLGVERTRGQGLEIERVCHALDGPREDCDYRIELDGKRVDCVPSEAQPEDGVARPVRCLLSLPMGARKVVIKAPASLETVGFVQARRVADGLSLPLTIVGRWYETSPERAARMTLLGPAVLRVAARTYAGAPATLRARIRSVAHPELSVEKAIALDPETDRLARRVEGNAVVTRVTDDYVPVPFDGPNTIELSSATRVLLRVDYAAATGLPRPRAEAPAAEPAQGRAGPKRNAVAPRLGVRVGWDPPPGPLTLRGYATALSSDLADTDIDPRTTYGELGAAAHRAVLVERLWAQVNAFGRVREGPESFGGRFALEVAQQGFAPGGFVRGRIAAQPFERFTGLGLFGQAGAFARVALDDGFGLTPLVALALRDADERAAGFFGVDSDVHTSYAETHPWSLDGYLHADQRVAVDALLRYGVAARAQPDFRGLDRGDASARARVIPGGGLAPSVELLAMASFRPAGPLRDEGFVRVSAEPSVLVWQWSGPTRLSAAASVGYSTDFPAAAGRGDEFSAALTLEGDFTFGRGLTDFSPVDRPFRARLEEGAEVPTRSSPARDPYWEEP